MNLNGRDSNQPDWARSNTKEGEMTPIFQLETLKIYLQMDVRNLFIEFQDRTIKKQTLKDLNEMVDWLHTHIEVDSVLLSSKHKEFGEGWNTTEWTSSTSAELEECIEELRQIVFKFIQVPQTVVADLKKGAKGASLELALGADIRIMEEGGRLVFDHLQQGMVPASGGLGVLSALMGRAQAKNWVQTSLPIPTNSLITSGFLQEVYNFQDGYTDTILDAISHQSPVARIQAKKAFGELIMGEVKNTQRVESTYAMAGYATGDFLKYLREKTHKVFTSARDWAQTLRGEVKEPVA